VNLIVYWYILLILLPFRWWVIAAYTLGGVAIGTFESNFLSTITALGEDNCIILWKVYE
jgi:hypothetical protein